ncbi:hypothetical protein NDU88_008282 [Pleurodeles waltl]|uniref:Uncharacterized protein n=1 Tax=Pleurodeles waltl TaxID=8319 RepID=A0AAV7RXJ1_PLEWA|nr:hypothetical protein NDU88_008282 [Pleurodeles waltl]
MAKSTQQTKMDLYTAQSTGSGQRMFSSGTPRDRSEPSGTQILAAIEASGLAVHAKIEAMALDVNLLRTDLCAVAERSFETDQQVSTMRKELDSLKAPVIALERRSHKLGARAEEAEV